MFDTLLILSVTPFLNSMTSAVFTKFCKAGDSETPGWFSTETLKRCHDLVAAHFFVSCMSCSGKLFPFSLTLCTSHSSSGVPLNTARRSSFEPAFGVQYWTCRSVQQAKALEKCAESALSTRHASRRTLLVCYSSTFLSRRRESMAYFLTLTATMARFVRSAYRLGRINRVSATFHRMKLD